MTEGRDRLLREQGPCGRALDPELRRDVDEHPLFLGREAVGDGDHERPAQRREPSSSREAPTTKGSPESGKSTPSRTGPPSAMRQRACSNQSLPSSAVARSPHWRSCTATGSASITKAG